MEEMVGSIVGESDFKQSLLYEIKQREELSSVVFSEKFTVPPIRPFGEKLKYQLLCQEPISWDNQSSHIQLALSPSLYVRWVEGCDEERFP
ncbi:MAG: hypothetical protein ACLS3V_00150 [Streptococcus sp.]